MQDFGRMRIWQLEEIPSECDSSPSDDLDCSIRYLAWLQWSASSSPRPAQSRPSPSSCLPPWHPSPSTPLPAPLLDPQSASAHGCQDVDLCMDSVDSTGLVLLLHQNQAPWQRFRPVHQLHDAFERKRITPYHHVHIPCRLLQTSMCSTRAAGSLDFNHSFTSVPQAMTCVRDFNTYQLFYFHYHATYNNALEMIGEGFYQHT